MPYSGPGQGTRFPVEIPMISVVICTYNRAPSLRRTLESFFRQDRLDHVPHEVIVVDNNSSDDTRAVVQAFENHPALRYVFEPKQGLSQARNRGADEARGDIVAYLDDDVLLAPEWLHALAACFADTRADVVGGQSVLRFEAPPPRWFGPHFRRYLSEVNLGAKRLESANGMRLYGLNVAYRRKTLLDAGGFRLRFGRHGDKLMSGEELDLNRRIAQAGGKIVYEPRALLEHVIPPQRTTWEYTLAMQRGAVDTRAMLDADAGPLGCVKNLADTAARLALFAAMRWATRWQDPEGYPARVAHCRHLRARLLLAKRREALARALQPSRL